MRGAPQVGFSAIIRKIGSRTSSASFFLSTCFLAFEIQLQYRRKPARCQPTTLSGLTSTRDCFQAPQKRRANTQKILSTLPSGVGDACVQHGQLLPEGEIFQEQASMRLQAAGKQAKP